MRHDPHGGMTEREEVLADASGGRFDVRALDETVGGKGGDVDEVRKGRVGGHSR